MALLASNPNKALRVAITSTSMQIYIEKSILLMISLNISRPGLKAEGLQPLDSLRIVNISCGVYSLAAFMLGRNFTGSFLIHTLFCIHALRRGKDKDREACPPLRYRECSRYLPGSQIA